MIEKSNYNEDGQIEYEWKDYGAFSESKTYTNGILSSEDRGNNMSSGKSAQCDHPNPV